ncbi:hypothetical protein N836_23365 [Leptolyngbya sp. Heron Island J]|nr:hypothetical protein N836_23365 [Leptolyngbya sp. Heron Island J]
MGIPTGILGYELKESIALDGYFRQITAMFLRKLGCAFGADF